MTKKKEHLEYCPGCRERKPIEEFLGANFVYDPEAPPIMCEPCKEKGPPPIDPVGLTHQQRLALKELMRDGTMTSAAKASGLSVSYVRDMLKGRTNPEFRRAFQLLLEMEGLDIFSIAKGLRSCAYAMEAKYHPAQEEMVYVPDMKTRLKAWTTLTRLHELDPPRKEQTETAIQIVIDHNLSPPTERDVTPLRHGEYEVEANATPDEEPT